MIRLVQWFFDDQSNTLQAVVSGQSGAADTVVWSTDDTSPPPQWIPSPLPDVAE